MNVSELKPEVLLRFEFRLRNQKFIPALPGCYALTTFDGLILYVGLSEQLRVRFGQHRESKEKTAVTDLGRVFWFYHLEAELNEIHRIERAWLNQHLDLHGEFPILNKMSSPVR